MDIPRSWSRASSEAKLPSGRTLPIFVWGWGSNEDEAKRCGADRLRSVLERLARGEVRLAKYSYGSRPLREEILETFRTDPGNVPEAIVTRNGYGAEVLNTARLLFLDVDLGPVGFRERIALFFRRTSVEQRLLGQLREALRAYGWATFRLYRTARGFRAMAIDREFDPKSSETRQLMQSTGTDPAYAKLCQAQASFRARLTPKPWRCESWRPPGRYPRLDPDVQEEFARWLERYQELSSRYATCRYIETIGHGSPKSSVRRLIELHDRATRCNETLPLA